MTKEQIETEGFDFETRGDGVFVLARRWVEEWGPFNNEEQACAAMLIAVPALGIIDQ